MLPFEISETIGKIIDLYPTSEEIMIASKMNSNSDIESIVRLWLSEGIPYIFRERPGLYEVVRNWISVRLGIHPKELTLIGSGRLGSSIAPTKTGKKFNKESDLDWSVISNNLFDQCKNVFEAWATDYNIGIVKPNKNEKHYWDENLKRSPNMIKRGFIDPLKIPTLKRYQLIQSIAQTMWLTTKKCELTKEIPKFKKSTIRVYKDWISFVRQLTLNLRTASSSFYGKP